MDASSQQQNGGGPPEPVESAPQTQNGGLAPPPPPPPPPPPMPPAGGFQKKRIPTEASKGGADAKAPARSSAAILESMANRDKKPFSYLPPGGINLADLKSPRMQRRMQKIANSDGPVAGGDRAPSVGGSSTSGSNSLIPQQPYLEKLTASSQVAPPHPSPLAGSSSVQARRQVVAATDPPLPPPPQMVFNYKSMATAALPPPPPLVQEVEACFASLPASVSGRSRAAEPSSSMDFPPPPSPLSMSQQQPSMIASIKVATPPAPPPMPPAPPQRDPNGSSVLLKKVGQFPQRQQQQQASATRFPQDSKQPSPPRFQQVVQKKEDSPPRKFQQSQARVEQTPPRFQPAQQKEVTPPRFQSAQQRKEVTPPKYQPVHQKEVTPPIFKLAQQKEEIIPPKYQPVHQKEVSPPLSQPGQQKVEVSPPRFQQIQQKQKVSPPRFQPAQVNHEQTLSKFQQSQHKREQSPKPQFQKQASPPKCQPLQEQKKEQSPPQFLQQLKRSSSPPGFLQKSMPSVSKLTSPSPAPAVSASSAVRGNLSSREDKSPVTVANTLPAAVKMASGVCCQFDPSTSVKLRSVVPNTGTAPVPPHAAAERIANNPPWIANRRPSASTSSGSSSVDASSAVATASLYIPPVARTGADDMVQAVSTGRHAQRWGHAPKTPPSTNQRPGDAATANRGSAPREHVIQVQLESVSPGQSQTSTGNNAANRTQTPQGQRQPLQRQHSSSAERVVPIQITMDEDGQPHVSIGDRDIPFWGDFDKLQSLVQGAHSSVQPDGDTPPQSKSFRVIQQVADQQNRTSNNAPNNTSIAGVRSVPLTDSGGNVIPAMRSVQLTDEDKQLMNAFRNQAGRNSDSLDAEGAAVAEGSTLYRGSHIPSRIFRTLEQSVDGDHQWLHGETDPRYRGAHIPSRAFRALQEATGEVPGDSQVSGNQSPGAIAVKYPGRRVVVNLPQDQSNGDSRALTSPPDDHRTRDGNKFNQARSNASSSHPSPSFRALQQMTSEGHPSNRED